MVEYKSVGNLVGTYRSEKHSPAIADAPADDAPRVAFGSDG